MRPMRRPDITLDLIAPSHPIPTHAPKITSQQSPLLQLAPIHPVLTATIRITGSVSQTSYYKYTAIGLVLSHFLPRQQHISPSRTVSRYPPTNSRRSSHDFGDPETPHDRTQTQDAYAWLRTRTRYSSRYCCLSDAVSFVLHEPSKEVANVSDSIGR